MTSEYWPLSLDFPLWRFNHFNRIISIHTITVRTCFFSSISDPGQYVSPVMYQFQLLTNSAGYSTRRLSFFLKDKKRRTIFFFSKKIIRPLLQPPGTKSAMQMTTSDGVMFVCFFAGNWFEFSTLSLRPLAAAHKNCWALGISRWGGRWRYWNIDSYITTPLAPLEINSDASHLRQTRPFIIISWNFPIEILNSKWRQKWLT